MVVGTELANPLEELATLSSFLELLTFSPACQPASQVGQVTTRVVTVYDFGVDNYVGIGE